MQVQMINPNIKTLVRTIFTFTLTFNASAKKFWRSQIDRNIFLIYLHQKGIHYCLIILPIYNSNSGKNLNIAYIATLNKIIKWIEKNSYSLMIPQYEIIRSLEKIATKSVLLPGNPWTRRAWQVTVYGVQKEVHRT